MASSLLAVVGALGGAAMLAGPLVGGGDDPTDIGWLYGGLAALALLVFALVFWWTRSFLHIVRARAAGHQLPVAFALIAVAITLWALERRPLPNERPSSNTAQIRESILGQFDVVLAVDPSEPAGRRLIKAARDALDRGRLDLLRPAPPAAALDVALGLAVAAPREGSGPLWRVLEEPTTDHVRVLVSLAGIETAETPPRVRSYGRLVHDLRSGVRWRDDALRGAVLVLDRLPSIAELDGGALARDAPATPCTRLVDGGLREVSSERSTPVAWRDALFRLCADRQINDAWEKDGRPPGSPEVRSVALYAITGEHRPGRLRAWRSWTAAVGGRVLRQGGSARPAEAARTTLAAAQDLHTGAPTGELAHVVRTFRPPLALRLQR